MSLINDALKKAAKEKGSSEKTPSFGSEGFDLSPPQKGWRGRRKIVFFTIPAAVLVFLGVVVAVSLKPQPLPKKAPTPIQAVKEQVPTSPPVSLSPPPSAPTTSLPPPSSLVPSIPIESSIALNGIVHGEGEEFAIINNQISRIGDEIDGSVLQEIGKDFVIFEKEEKRFKLKMK